MAVYGRVTDARGKPRSASTSVNRIEFPDQQFSTLKTVQSLINSTMVWEEATYTGYKLNCHKRKRKVENMIDMYDKDSVNNVWDKEI